MGKKGTKSSSTGGRNVRHMFAADVDHLSDHQKARVLAKTAEGARLRKKMMRIARANARNKDPEALKRLEAYLAKQRANQVAPTDQSVRFPSMLGHGYSTIRLDLIRGGGEPELHVCSGEEYESLYRKLGDWHSRYPGNDPKKEPNAFWPVRDAEAGRVAKDGRFAYGTLTLPRWDTEALQQSVSAGELTEAELKAEVFDRLEQWAQTDGPRLFSCGASRSLIFCGSDFHLADGTLHGHINFLKSARSGYRRADGTIQPRSEAPTGGRPRKGEGWEGGERLGLVSTNGHLVFNSLGVAGCATDALREEGFLPPLDFRDVDQEQGKPWASLDRAIQRRRDGGFSYLTSEGKAVWVKETGVRLGVDGKGIGLDPADLVGSRQFRQLVRDLAERVPAFGKRRAALIEKAKADRAQVDRDLLKLVAGDELARRDLDLDAKAGKIEDLSAVLDEVQRERDEAKAASTAALEAARQERERLEREKAEAEAKTAALEQQLASAPKGSPDADVLRRDLDQAKEQLRKAQKVAAGALAAVTASTPTLFEFVREYALTGKVPETAKGLIVFPGGKLSFEPLGKALAQVLRSRTGAQIQIQAAEKAYELAMEVLAFVNTSPSTAAWATKRAEWAAKYPLPEAREIEQLLEKHVERAIEQVAAATAVELEATTAAMLRFKADAAPGLIAGLAAAVPLAAESQDCKTTAPTQWAAVSKYLRVDDNVVGWARWTHEAERIVGDYGDLFDAKVLVKFNETLVVSKFDATEATMCLTAAEHVLNGTAVPEGLRRFLSSDGLRVAPEFRRAADVAISQLGIESRAAAIAKQRDSSLSGDAPQWLRWLAADAKKLIVTDERLKQRALGKVVDLPVQRVPQPESGGREAKVVNFPGNKAVGEE